MEWDRKRFSHFMTAVLGGKGYFLIHRALISKFGVEVAAVLHYLFNFNQRVMDNDGYSNDGWFYCRWIDWKMSWV